MFPCTILYIPTVIWFCLCVCIMLISLFFLTRLPGCISSILLNSQVYGWLPASHSIHFFLPRSVCEQLCFVPASQDLFFIYFFFQACQGKLQLYFFLPIYVYRYTTSVYTHIPLLYVCLQCLRSETEPIMVAHCNGSSFPWIFVAVFSLGW